jgi:hypothetical protein
VAQATQLFAFISVVFGAGTAVIAFYTVMLDLRQHLQRPGTGAPAASSAASVPQSQAPQAAPAPQRYPSYPAPAPTAYHVSWPPAVLAALPPVSSARHRRARDPAGLVGALCGRLLKTSTTRANLLTGALTEVGAESPCFQAGDEWPS